MRPFFQRIAPFAVVGSVILSALALVRSADLDALRLADQSVSSKLEMEIRERERLDDYLRQYRDLQMTNTARIEQLENEIYGTGDKRDGKKQLR